MAVKIRILVVAVLLGALHFFPACSQVNFSPSPDSSSECHGSGQNCVTQNGVETYDYNITTDALKADILFAVDTSASMYPIQQSLGSRFPSLFDKVSGYDFHIGIITLDVSGNGPLQSGNLIHFPDGNAFLTNDSTGAEWQFSQTIQRDETRNCEQWLHDNCDPNIGCVHDATYDANCTSEDTRAITATNMALDGDTSGFFRKGVPLQLVIVSNSDERAAGGHPPGQPFDSSDLPSTLVTHVAQKFANQNPLAVASIIIQPGDSSCYNAQKVSSKIFGWYGSTYDNLASMTSNMGGASSSICASDYSQPMSIIGSNVARIASITLPCPPLNNSDFYVALTPDPGFSALPPDGTSTIHFPNAVPPNTQIHVHYQCNVN